MTQAEGRISMVNLSMTREDYLTFMYLIAYRRNDVQRVTRDDPNFEVMNNLDIELEKLSLRVANSKTEVSV